MVTRPAVVDGFTILNITKGHPVGAFYRRQVEILELICVIG